MKIIYFKWSGNDNDQDQLKGALVQIMVNCSSTASVDQQQQQYCIAFRIQGIQGTDSYFVCIYLEHFIR
jgi:hypothetical protein